VCSSFGTILAQKAWLPVLRTPGTRPCSAGPDVSRAGQVFHGTVEMVHEKAKAQLQQFLAGFVAALHAR
jgi:chromate reductase